MNKEAAEILTEARKSKGLTQTQMAEKLADALSQGYSARQYQKLEEGNFPKYKKEIVSTIDKLLGTNLLGIVYEHDIHTDNKETEPAITNRLATKLDNGPFLVPFVDIPAQAGYIKGYDQTDYLQKLKKYPILPDVDHRGATWRYFQVEGDSMEPEIKAKDLILASQVPKEDWADNIREYYTHVIITDSNLWIKDVFPESESEWILLSQNENYEPFPIKVEDIKEVWVMRRHIKARANKSKMYDMDEIRKRLKKN